MYKNDIRLDAGIIWSLLAEKGSISLHRLIELTNFKEGFLMMAIGWLAHENEILITEKNGTTYLELTHSVSDMYL